MSFDLSFSQEFLYGEGYSIDEPPPRSDKPTSVLQALVSLSDEELEELRESVGIDILVSYDTAIAEIFDRVRETNTCTNLRSPVEVWIDPKGWHTLLVY
jgi:hypothetical protein